MLHLEMEVWNWIWDETVLYLIQHDGDGPNQTSQECQTKLDKIDLKFNDESP